MKQREMKLEGPQSQGEKLLCGTLLRMGERGQLRWEPQAVGWALGIVHHGLLSLKECEKRTDVSGKLAVCPELTGDTIPLHVC